jgi:hypothetical protein
MRVHIKGWGKNMNILDELSDNWELDSFSFDEESTYIIPNVIVQIWHTKKECGLEKATEGHLRAILGDLSLTGQDYGYSEYTIEGFNINEAKIGNHELQPIIDNYKDEYLNILITEMDR